MAGRPKIKIFDDWSRRRDEDVEVAVCRIPKDTLVLGNLYAVNNDPNVWVNPREFRPERFLGTDGKYVGGDHPVIAFGTGRRSCTGQGKGWLGMSCFSLPVKAVSSDLPDGHNFSITVSPEMFQVVFQRRKTH